MPKIIQETDPSNLGEALKAPFACLKFGLFGLFFQPEQCFSLTTIQPEQCFSASFSQNSDQRTGPLRCSKKINNIFELKGIFVFSHLQFDGVRVQTGGSGMEDTKKLK